MRHALNRPGSQRRHHRGSAECEGCMAAEAHVADLARKLNLALDREVTHKRVIVRLLREAKDKSK